MPTDFEHTLDLLESVITDDDLREATDAELSAFVDILAHWRNRAASEQQSRAEARKAQGALDL